MDPLATVAQLKATHATGQHDVGVDARNRRVISMTGHGVLEPMAGKLAQLTLAAEAANAILRIDQVHRAR